MLLQLAELLACPSCGPGHGLVVTIDRIEGRRVLEGLLSCPTCEARFPVREGVMDFRAARGASGDAAEDAAVRETSGSAGAAAAEEGEAAAEDGGVPTEDALRVAALLDLGEGAGVAILGPALADVAAEVAELAPGAEVLSLCEVGDHRTSGRLSRAVGVSPAMLPLHGRRCRGAALVGGSPKALAEAARVVAPGGRVVVLRPGPEASAAARRLPLEIVAHEDVALVALRRHP
jgi:uncharacterized protein YbaR (Trm112 family)